MTQLYTRGGDQGMTGILEKVRLSKAEGRFEAIGTIDELNAHIGLAIAMIEKQSSNRAIEQSGNDDRLTHGAIVPLLLGIQSDLFTIGSYLAQPTPAADSPLPADHVSQLERQIDEWNAAAPDLRHFILPGGVPAAAQLQVARTVCRRAERCLVRLGDELVISPQVLVYLNRLSDYLFAAARAINHHCGVTESTWQGA